jgi:hypothetical protein
MVCVCVYNVETMALSQAWWSTPIILALGRLRQEDLEFEVGLGCIVRLYLKK